MVLRLPCPVDNFVWRVALQQGIAKDIAKNIAKNIEAVCTRISAYHVTTQHNRAREGENEQRHDVAAKGTNDSSRSDMRHGGGNMSKRQRTCCMRRQIPDSLLTITSARIS